MRDTALPAPEHASCIQLDPGYTGGNHQSGQGQQDSADQAGPEFQQGFASQ